MQLPTIKYVKCINYLYEASGQDIILRGTDLDLSISAEISAKLFLRENCNKT